MFKFTRTPPKFTGFKKPTPAPEPEKKPSFKPIDLAGYEGVRLRLGNICNWTGKQVYDPDSAFHAARHNARREEIFTLTELAGEYLNEGQSADRIIDRIEANIKTIDPNANL